MIHDVVHAVVVLLDETMLVVVAVLWVDVAPSE